MVLRVVQVGILVLDVPFSRTFVGIGTLGPLDRERVFAEVIRMKDTHGNIPPSSCTIPHLGRAWGRSCVIKREERIVGERIPSPCRFTIEDCTDDRNR